MRKTIIAAPVHLHKEYILFQWLQYITTNYAADVDEILLVDNTVQDASFHAKIKAAIPENLKHKVKVVYKPGNFKMSVQERMLNCQNYIRQYCIERGCDLFFIECDVFPPKDLIKRFSLIRETYKFLENNPLSAMYFTGLEEYSYVPFQTKTIINGNCIVRNMHPNEMFFNISGMIEVFEGTSFGCVLLPLSILQRFPFRINAKENAKAHADTFFYTDLIAANVKSYAHTGMYCKHINKSWNDVYSKETIYELLKD